MELKKEVQDRIIKSPDNVVTDEELFSILKLLAPGTNLRTALDGALKTRRGALIVVENEQIQQVIDGGFRINTRFTPQKLIELSKMDGAIILSKDMKKINYANVLLTPSHKIKTSETGTRHKAAERTARQIGTLVMAISERKHEINIFYRNLKYPIINTDELLRKANEHMQLLEKQRELFDNNIEKLNNLEIRNRPSMKQAVNTLQKGLLIQKISKDLKKYLVELGKESMILKMRLNEITKGVEREIEFIIKDYTQLSLKISKTLLEDLTYDEIPESENVLEALGYEKAFPIEVPIKGWRLLSKTSLHESEIAAIINKAGSLGKSLHSPINFYIKILGQEKAPVLQEELGKIRTNDFSIL